MQKLRDIGMEGIWYGTVLESNRERGDLITNKQKCSGSVAYTVGVRIQSKEPVDELFRSVHRIRACFVVRVCAPTF